MDILIPAWIDGQLQPVEKLQTHLRGLRHKAVSVFVMSGAETLLQRRALSKYHTPAMPAARTRNGAKLVLTAPSAVLKKNWGWRAKCRFTVTRWNIAQMWAAA
jgi:hypothetical protein